MKFPRRCRHNKKITGPFCEMLQGHVLDYKDFLGRLNGKCDVDGKKCKTTWTGRSAKLRGGLSESL